MADLSKVVTGQMIIPDAQASPAFQAKFVSKASILAASPTVQATQTQKAAEKNPVGFLSFAALLLLLL